MDSFHYQDSPYAIRADLPAAYRRYWQALAGPGNWFSGAERVAIAAEVRNAIRCPFCAERRQALSPYTVEGHHLSGDLLSGEQVDAFHRIITDQSRITQAWIDQNAAKGFSEEQYVELLGIAVTVFSIDEFNRALGLPLEALPAPLPGEPDHYRPTHSEHGTGFVAMIPPDGAGDEVVVDAAAVAANFQRMVRIADSTGIPIDARNAALSVGVRRELDLGRFASAANSPADTVKTKLLSLIARPMARRALGKKR